jgi:hypothetical protein
MYFPRLDATGRLLELRMLAMQMRRFQLCRATEQDTRWLAGSLDRASSPLGASVSLANDGSLLLDWK